MKRLAIIVGMLLLALGAQAQPAPAKAIALAIENNALVMGELALNNDTNTIHFGKDGRYARTDAIGLIRFVPAGGPEGVYTFPPYVDGWTAANANENRLWAREAVLSPDGNQLAFRIENPNFADDIASGIWFWQPARELSSDPSYQLLRHCPPCSQSGAGNADNWRSTSIEWSSDNVAILVGLDLRNEQRHALHVSYALRDPNNTQAINRANPFRYDYGHWTLDGQRIVVSGNDPLKEVVFGTIGRDGGTPAVTAATKIGMTWVQDAVDIADGRIVMLGSPTGNNTPLQLVDNTGAILSQAIGETAPATVIWNREHTAVFLRTSQTAYVALLDGTIYDVSGVVRGIPAVDWVQDVLPASATRLPDPSPSVTGVPPKAGTGGQFTTQNAPVFVPSTNAIGTIMTVQVSGLALYAEPVLDAEVRATLKPGDELILTGGPLTDGVNLWWRVQTLNLSGWLTETRDGIATIQPVQ